MKEIAIYGKGGIGKSTLSANISAALSLKGKRVLQIGCDPKHDSTKLLMDGINIPTVLDYIKSHSVLEYKLSDVLYDGFNSVGCIEAGGPKPGVGCAGRGIITAFELLEKFHAKKNYDMVVYDVLGDVVCGGFAVPIRREYSDAIFIVTSGEYMSLYAANNILRGIQNYDGNSSRVAGLLFNSRNVKDEDTRVQKFAEAVNLPIFAKVPRRDIFAFAEKEERTVVALADSDNKDALEVYEIFSSIADNILNSPKLHTANPLSDEELENLILRSDKPTLSVEIPRKDEIKVYGLEADTCDTCSQNDKPNYDSGYLSKNVIRDEPLHGCAFNGAMTMSSNLNDCVILSHSPKSCTYLSIQTITSAGRRRLFERGTLLSSSLMPNIATTNMSETDMVFGGSDKLLETVKKLISDKNPPKAIVIVSSCPSGIIGDDINDALSLSTEKTKVVTIKAEGNLTGDYLQGMLMAYTSLAKQIIDKSVCVIPKTVNIVFEKVVARNTEDNFRRLNVFLFRMGIKVNCRFLFNTSYDSLKNFCSAELNLMGHRDYTGKILEDFFIENYGSKFYEHHFPIGFAETSDWLIGLGNYFNELDEAKKIIAENENIYCERIEKVKPALKGKKLMIITFNHELDWILKAALDAGMEIVKICILNFSQDEGFRSKLPEIKTLDVCENYDKSCREADISRLKPDILLTNYESSNVNDYVSDTIPMCPDTGFYSGLEIIERWTTLFDSKTEGEWLNDRKFFDKYYGR